MHVAAILFIWWSPSPFQNEPETKIVWVSLPKGKLEEFSTAMKRAENLPQSTLQEQKLPPVKDPSGKKTIEPPKTRDKKPDVTATHITKKAKPKPKPKTDIDKALEALDKKLKGKNAGGLTAEAAQIPDEGEGSLYGTSTEPIRVPPNDPEYVLYQAKVRHKILNEWVLPLAYVEVEQPPTARVVVLIDETGKITSQKWESSSGNPAFDASCQRAVQRASPLPVPPERLKWEAFNEGFLIEFDPGLKG